MDIEDSDVESVRGAQNELAVVGSRGLGHEVESYLVVALCTFVFAVVIS